jgi:hypothetical protein
MLIRDLFNDALRNSVCIERNDRIYVNKGHEAQGNGVNQGNNTTFADGVDEDLKIPVSIIPVTEYHD